MRNYEALVRALREHSKPEGCDCNVCPCYDAEERGYSTCSEELTEKAADAIDELSKLQASYKQVNWIRVEDRLPECEPGAEVGNITFRLKSGTIYTGCFGRGGLQRDKYFRNWTDSGEGWDAEYVTHWVRLPDPEEVRKCSKS